MESGPQLLDCFRQSCDNLLGLGLVALVGALLWTFQDGQPPEH